VPRTTLPVLLTPSMHPPYAELTPHLPPWAPNDSLIIPLVACPPRLALFTPLPPPNAILGLMLKSPWLCEAPLYMGWKQELHSTSHIANANEDSPRIGLTTLFKTFRQVINQSPWDTHTVKHTKSFPLELKTTTHPLGGSWGHPQERTVPARLMTRPLH